MLIRKLPKQRSKRRRRSELRMWEAIVDYANTEDLVVFKRLTERGFSLLEGWIDDPIMEGLPPWKGSGIHFCADLRRGGVLESLAVQYRRAIILVLKWLSDPEVNASLALDAASVLHVYASDIKTFSVGQTGFRVTDKNCVLISESLAYCGAVISPVCKFIREQIDRHDLYGEKLRTVIPVGQCDRQGCDKFRLIKAARKVGPFYCSDLCRAKVHQSNTPKSAKAEAMRKYRARIAKEAAKRASESKRTK